MWGETGGCDCSVSTSLFEPMVRKVRGLVDFGKRSLTHKAQATEKAHCPLMSNSKKVAARGVEPLTKSNVSGCQRATCTSNQDSLAAPALQGCDTNCPFKASIDSELLELVESWAQVPKHARETILTLGRLRME